jgi:hypothetical protein
VDTQPPRDVRDGGTFDFAVVMGVADQTARAAAGCQHAASSRCGWGSYGGDSDAADDVCQGTKK